MYQTALVGFDSALGEEVVHALDASGIKPQVVLWAYLQGYDDWRLVISGKSLDTLPLDKAYLQVNDAMDAAGISVRRAPSTLVLPLADPFIRKLRQQFRKAADLTGMRLGGQLIGQHFVEAGYVYRIS